VLFLPVSARRAAVLAVAGAAACVSLAGLAIPAGAATVSGSPGGSSTYTITVPPPVGVAAAGSPSTWSAPGASSGSVPGSLRPPGAAGAPPRQLFVPDLIAAVPSGITPAELARIGKLKGVRAVLPVDGGRITING
jgi:hypothetical protein